MSINKATLKFTWDNSNHSLEIDPPYSDCPQEISFDFVQNCKDKHNLYTLLNKKAGERLIYDNGLLQKSSGLKGRIHYCFNSRREQEKVKKCVKELFKNLDKDLLILSSQERPTISETHAFVLSHLFSKHGAIGRLSHSLFDIKSLGDKPLLEKYVFFNRSAVRLKIGSPDSVTSIFDFESSKLPITLNERLDQSENVFNIQLSNAASAHNVFMLLNRKRAERFVVDKEGKLCSAKTLTGRLKLLFFKKRELAKISAVVDQVLIDLEQISNGHKENLVIRALFKELFISPKGNMATLSRQIFNRYNIAEGSNLESILSYNPETLQTIHSQREDFKRSLKTLRDSTDENYDKNRETVIEIFTNLCHAEFELAKSLGIDLKEAGGGSGGARFGFSRFEGMPLKDGEKSTLNGKLFVIKPGDEGPHGKNNPQKYSFLKKLFISPKRCLRNNSEPLAELHSYLLDKSFKLHIVPPTLYKMVNSSKFHGQSTKDCSLQMYVEGSNTLAKTLNISEDRKLLPRFLLKKMFKKREAELSNKLPQKLLEIVSAHNVLIEDIDCHFGNIMVKEKKTSHHVPETLLSKEKLLNNNNPISDEVIDEFVDNLFSRAHNGVSYNHLFLQETFASKDNKIIIKHDGGASHPNRHPTGYLSLRFKHLFEVLPHFEGKFSKETAELFQNKHAEFYNYLLAKTENEINNINMTLVQEGKDKASQENEFQTDIRALVEAWSLNQNDKNIVDRMITRSIGFIHAELNKMHKTELNNKRVQTFINSTLKDYEAYYRFHLSRIGDSVKTRVDSWNVFMNHLAKQETIQEGPRGSKKVRTDTDLKNEPSNLTKNERAPIIRDLLSVRNLYHFEQYLKNASETGFSDYLTTIRED